jgi:hypothetical protein
MTSSPRTLHRLSVGLCLAGCAFGLPSIAHAQFAERLSLSIEGSASTHLLAPQSTEYGFGFLVGGRGAIRLAGPVALQVYGSYGRWGASDPQLKAGVLSMFGGGLRLAPEVSRSAGRFVLDADVGFTLTGSDDPATGGVKASALVFSGGLGWLFPVASVVSIGPMVRVHYLTNLDAGQAGDRDRSLFWSAGVSFTFHGARADESAPRPDEGEPTVNVRRAPSDDTDRDGVPDTDDRCVTEPETRNGFRDDDGCPDTPSSPDDPDNDQIRGATDQCPEQAEDFDGHLDTDGCPEPDNDNDGVLDAQDQCGDQPETRNGFQDDDGCPDTGGSGGGASIPLPGVVEMDGRDVSAASRATLDAVAQQFAQHPEILRVQVECRTDAGGSDRRNVRASTACARAVVRYLRRAGVAKRRLRASGAGSLHAAAGAPQTQVTLTIVESASAPAAGPTPTGGEEGGRRGRRGRHGRRRH